jgi:hypothetical protein
MLKLIATASLVMGCASVGAQGYFDFGQVPGLAGEPKVQIDLNAAMLGFVREAARAADPDSAAAIDGIEGVRVRVYEIDDEVGPVIEFIDNASRRLEADGWQRMVYVQDSGSRVLVYVNFAGELMSGLTVMVAEEDGKEAVFINLLGELDPAKIGAAAAALGMKDVIPDLSGN